MHSPTHLFPAYTLSLSLVGFICIVLVSVAFAEGSLVYTLDDPYIHLSVAESILEGGYGINPSEKASPSSSILYPYILAFGLWLGLGTYGPLLIAGLFSLLSIWIVARFAARLLPDGRGSLSYISFALLGLGMMFSLNTIALPMTGMEHSIHVFGVVLTLTRLYDMLVEERPNQLWGVILGCLICVTIRFEGFALVFAVGFALVLDGRWRSALILLASTLSTLAAYGFYMVNSGLPFMPSSVLVKSNLASDATDGRVSNLLAQMFDNASQALKYNRGRWLGLCAFFLAVCSLDRGKSRGFRLFCATVSIMLIGHVLAGKYSWFSRYEIYAGAGMMIGLIVIVSRIETLKSVQTLALAVFFLVFSIPYARTTLLTPAASANIYQQQYQMHRFVQDYFPAPVAVNDLGWVAYQNEHYVLDLWGLGSEEARKLTAAGGWTQAKLTEITARKDIEYAMIYESWIKNIPDQWCRAAQLVTSQVSSADDTVSFYLINKDAAPRFFQALRAFEQSLPTGARLELGDCTA